MVTDNGHIVGVCMQAAATTRPTASTSRLRFRLRWAGEYVPAQLSTRQEQRDPFVESGKLCRRCRYEADAVARPILRRISQLAHSD